MKAQAVPIAKARVKAQVARALKARAKAKVALAALTVRVKVQVVLARKDVLNLKAARHHAMKVAVTVPVAQRVKAAAVMVPVPEVVAVQSTEAAVDMVLNTEPKPVAVRKPVAVLSRELAPEVVAVLNREAAAERIPVRKPEQVLRPIPVSSTEAVPRPEL